MEALSSSATYFSIKTLPIKHRSTLPHSSINFPNSATNKNLPNLSSSSSPFPFISCVSSPSSTSAPYTSPSSSTTRHWMVLMEGPPQKLNSKPEIINYYAKTLERVLGRAARKMLKCVFMMLLLIPTSGFAAKSIKRLPGSLLVSVLAGFLKMGLPGVLSVLPDPDVDSTKKVYGSSRIQSQTGTISLFPAGNIKRWLVRMDKPGVGIVTKAQMVDFYSEILTKVLGNEQDAQMCIYHVSWQSHFGFCCELDEECAKELAGVPGVLSVQPDQNFESVNKDYGGGKNSTDQVDSSEASQTTPVQTKKLFITGLSFYTSEKTLRAAFEGFGELVQVKIIMDKISKRSKGYAFVEYTTEEAAGAALKEMNGKIINGWMIVVDVAKTSPQRYGRSR